MWRLWSRHTGGTPSWDTPSTLCTLLFYPCPMEMSAFIVSSVASFFSWFRKIGYLQHLLHHRCNMYISTCIFFHFISNLFIFIVASHNKCHLKTLYIVKLRPAYTIAHNSGEWAFLGQIGWVESGGRKKYAAVKTLGRSIWPVTMCCAVFIACTDSMHRWCVLYTMTGHGSCIMIYITLPDICQYAWSLKFDLLVCFVWFRRYI